MPKIELETKLEDRCCAKIEARGGVALKLSILGVRGFPDRTALMPEGRVAFYEFKRPRTGRVSAQQVRWRAVLSKLGYNVYVIDNDADFDAALERETNHAN
jgi:hypothetical protein